MGPIGRGSAGSTGLIGRAAAAAIAGLILALALAADANAQRPFEQRFGDNARGNIAFAANTLLTCPAAHASCAGAQDGTLALNNNNFSLVNVDVDGFVDQNSDTVDDTRNSSRATLTMPAGSNVLFAGLYWGGVVPSNLDPANPADVAEFGRVEFDVPGPGGYQTTNATVTPCTTPPPPVPACVDAPSVGGGWQGFADVTAQVQGAGAGEYTVGDVPLLGGKNRYGGWTMVVAYEHESETWRNLSVFDGLVGIGTTDVTLSGFVTPPTGAFDVAFGSIAYDGDIGGNDSARFRVGSQSLPLSDAVNPFNDYSAARITRLGSHVTDKDPDYRNQLGYDSKTVAGIGGDPPPTGHIDNGATSAIVRLSRGSDYMATGLMWTAIELFAPDVSGTKQITNVTDPGQPAEPNDVLEYEIAYANAPDDPNDPVDAAGNFVITDPIPANMNYVANSLEIDGVAPNPTDAPDADSAEVTGGNAVFRVGAGASGATGGTLAPGQSTTVRFRVEVAGASPGHLSTNEARANFRAVTLDAPFEDTASASIPVIPVADLSLDKDGPATVEAGEDITYTLDVFNDGPSTSDPTLTDELPAGLTFDAGASDPRCSAVGQDVTCDLDPLTAGQGTTVTIVASVALGASAGAIENDAEVTGTVPEADPLNNDDSVETQVLIGSDLGLTKTASVPLANVGDQITYTLEVTNNGPLDTPSAQITDTLPAGLAFVPSPGGSSPECSAVGQDVTCNLAGITDGDSAQVQVVVDVQAPASGTRAVNDASVTGPNPDTEPTNDGASAAVDIPPVANLSVTKSADPDPVDDDADITYTLEVANAGPTDSVVEVTDTLPSGLVYDDAASDTDCDPGGGQDVVCTLTLNAGGSDTLTIVAHVPDGATGTLENTATIASTDDPNTPGIIDPVPEGDQNDNSDTIESQIAPPESDLRLEKSAPSGPLEPGDQIPYAFTVTNDGPDPSPNTTVTDTLPAELSYISDDGGCANAGQDVTCDLATLAPGASESFTVTARVDAVGGGSVTNSAGVSGDSEDIDPDDNGSTATTATRPAPQPQAEAPVPDESRCFFGNVVTILGTNGPDRIVGTPGRDVINGLRGDDVILGLDGDDLICGGRGDDLIKGGNGDDRVKGSKGDDRIIGNKGSDWLRGAQGDDVISGRTGNDRLMGNRGDDILRGKRGDDFLLGGPGRDKGNGGPGRDRARGLTKAFRVENLLDR